MELYGIEVELKNIPPLEPDFVPIMLWTKEYLAEARDAFAVAITGENGRRAVTRTRIRNDGKHQEADRFYVRHLVKSLLWLYGGYRVTIIGAKTMYDYLNEIFSREGAGHFEIEFMEKVYGQSFHMENLIAIPRENATPRFMPKHLNGYRIGLETSNSNRHVVAIANGRVVYNEEVLWHPSEESDPDYHYRGIMDSIHSAARRLPRIDGIGIASAGVHFDGEVRDGTLFRSISPEDFDQKIRTVFTRVATAMNCNNLHILNEGDVSALSCAMSLDFDGILSLSMGSTQATGYIDNDGNVSNWLNELAYIPIDINPDAVQEVDSGDRGCGVDYFSRGGLLRLARLAGIYLRPDQNEAEQVRSIQVKAELEETKAVQVFQSLGVALGHTLGYYHSMYQFQCVLLLGRIMAGAGGDLVFNAAQKVLAEEYPIVASQIIISLPEENNQRVSHAVAAATLPEIQRMDA